MQDILYTPQIEDHLHYMENVMNKQEAFAEAELGNLLYALKGELEDE